MFLGLFTNDDVITARLRCPARQSHCHFMWMCSCVSVSSRTCGAFVYEEVCSRDELNHDFSSTFRCVVCHVSVICTRRGGSVRVRCRSTSKRTTVTRWNNMGTCVVAGAPVSNGHPQVNVHLSQEPMDVNADTWDELQRLLTEVSQHVQLLRSRIASLSASHAGSGKEREAAQRQ